MKGFDGWLAGILARVPFIGMKLVALQGRLASFGEQGLQGVSNLVVNALLARALTHEGFATIGAMIGIHFVLLGFHRATIVLPYILDASHTSDDDDGTWWWASLAFIGVIAAIMVVIAAVLTALTVHRPQDRWMAEAAGLTVLVSPALLLFEFGRRMLYQRHLPATVALASAVYFILNVGGSYLLAKFAPSARIGAMAWVIAGLGGALVTLIAAPPGRPRLRHPLNVLWENRRFTILQMLTAFPYAVYTSAIVVLVGAFGGAAPAAAVAAARTLTNPAASMVTAVDSLDKPRAVRALAAGGLAGLKASISKTRRLLFLLTGSYLGLLIIFAPWALTLAFGDAYQDRVGEIRVLALAFFLMGLYQPSETKLIVLRASGLLLTMRVIAAATAFGSLALVGRWGVMGACLAVMFTQLVYLISLFVAERIAVTRWRQANPSAA